MKRAASYPSAKSVDPIPQFKFRCLQNSWVNGQVHIDLLATSFDGNEPDVSVSRFCSVIDG